MFSVRRKEVLQLVYEEKEKKKKVYVSIPFEYQRLQEVLSKS